MANQDGKVSLIENKLDGISNNISKHTNTLQDLIDISIRSMNQHNMNNQIISNKNSTNQEFYDTEDTAKEGVNKEDVEEKRLDGI